MVKIWGFCALKDSTSSKQPLTKKTQRYHNKPKQKHSNICFAQLLFLSTRFAPSLRLGFLSSKGLTSLGRAALPLPLAPCHAKLALMGAALPRMREAGAVVFCRVGGRAFFLSVCFFKVLFVVKLFEVKWGGCGFCYAFMAFKWVLPRNCHFCFSSHINLETAAQTRLLLFFGGGTCKGTSRKQKSNQVYSAFLNWI